MTILKFWLAVSRSCIIMLDLLPVISAQIHHRTHLTVTVTPILIVTIKNGIFLDCNPAESTKRYG